MNITTEFKKVLIDWFSRLSLAAVIAFIITPFVTDAPKIDLLVLGIITVVVSLGIALLFAATIKEEAK